LAGAEASLLKKEFHGGKFVVYAWPHASLKEFVMVARNILLGSKFVWAQDSKSQAFDPSR